MLLKRVTLNKYKSYTTSQSFEVEDGITRIVGKNESGKTAILEALSKFNYFEDDDDFKYNETLDYPRNELKVYQKVYQREGIPATVISCEFQIDDDLIDKIEEELGIGILEDKKFIININYNHKKNISNLDTNFHAFVQHIIKKYKPNGDLAAKIEEYDNIESLIEYCEEHPEELKKVLDKLTNIRDAASKNSWSNKLNSYI